MKHELTVKRLAEILYEELDLDGWGDIDPYWILGVAKNDPEYGDIEVPALKLVLERVVARLNG